MPSRSFVYMVFYIVLAAGLFVGSLAISRTYFTKNAPTTTTAEPTPTPHPDEVAGTNSSGGGIERFVGRDGTVYYHVRGVIVKNFAIQEGALVGALVIDGDPNKTPVPVSLDVRTGTAKIAFFTKTFDEEVEETSLSVVALLEKLTRGVRAIVYLSAGPVTSESPVGAGLSSAIAGSWSSTGRLAFEPLFLGIIGHP